MYTFDAQIVSDLHKEARGFRPREGFWAVWNEALPAGKQMIWENLLREADARADEEARAQKEAYAAWSQRIRDIMEMGCSEADAIRWDMDACEVDGDVGFYCFQRGLDYSVEQEIRERLTARA